MDVGNGTVRDEKTGLIWAADANLQQGNGHWDGHTWEEALRFIDEMNEGLRPNFGYQDWRLPRAEELATLFFAFWRPGTYLENLGRVFSNYSGTDLPAGRMGWKRDSFAPFLNVTENAYWSGTSASLMNGEFKPGAYSPSAGRLDTAEVTDHAWAVDTTGSAFVLNKVAEKRVWPVRGPDVSAE